MRGKLVYKRVRNTNSWIEREGSVVRLMSYETLVCEVDTEKRLVLLSPAARCSRTTIRHLSSFMRELGLSYYAAKAVLVSPDPDRVEVYNDYTFRVSCEPRFKFRATSPCCLI